MHDKIYSVHSCTQFQSVNYPDIFIADFSERTKTKPPKRSVEISANNQPSPDGNGDMDSAVFHNNNGLNIEFAMYDDYTYHDISGNNIQHCECTMYIPDMKPLKWVAFLELKDCLPKNIHKHKKKAKEQIKNVVDDFKTRGILTNEIVYGIISCPQKKIAFNDSIIGDTIEWTKLKRLTGINYFGTNETFILSSTALLPKV